MLGVISEILRERGALARDEAIAFDVRLTAEHLLHVVARTQGGATFHNKVKECGSLPNEYENYRDAWRTFPDYVPELVAHEYRNAREVIVIRGVAHRPLTAGSIRRNKRGLAGRLVRFLDVASTEARITSPAATHRAFLRRAEAGVSDPLCATIIRRWIDDERIDALPHIRQHGDFVINNLGLTSTGLVVFDWEDFGRICLPGFDLCTLLASDAGFETPGVLALTRGSKASRDAAALMVEQTCPKMGLTPALFRQLVPLYLSLFLDLKMEYGIAIADRVRRSLASIGAAPGFPTESA